MEAKGQRVFFIFNVFLHQINWSLSKQELLFSDFNEGENIEEGSEFNKVQELYSVKTMKNKIMYTDRLRKWCKPTLYSYRHCTFCSQSCVVSVLFSKASVIIIL